MYYNNLTINSDVRLKANGWRIVVVGILTVNGSITHDGNDAVANGAGSAAVTMYSTYLGSGTSGGQGLTAAGNGNMGITSPCQNAGGIGGYGGKVAGNAGGSPGTYVSISETDGGIQSLGTLPIGFLGRLVSENHYISGGTGGGSGAAIKGTATTVKSGGGGGGGGVVVIAARIISGNGLISAKGGNGGSGTYTGNGSSGGVGSGGGGGGGCIIVIYQDVLSNDINFNVQGGQPGSAISPGLSGTEGSTGNIFKIQA